VGLQQLEIVRLAATLAGADVTSFISNLASCGKELKPPMKTDKCG
jgi:hypothetical protein